MYECLVKVSHWCLLLFKGYRTLDDLRKSGKLTRVQQIGLKHYDEFVERMPRSEAAEIEDKVSSFMW